MHFNLQNIPMASGTGMRQLKMTKSVTKRDEIFNKYLLEVNKTELIDALEEVDLAKKIKAGDEKALQALTLANLRFVISVAKQYQNQWLSLPDLVNEGNLGLIKAGKRFDETRGFKFISYAVWRIRQTILQAIAEQGRIVRLPLNKVAELNKFNKGKEKLEQEFGREPTEEEITEMIEKPIENMEFLRWNTMKHISLDEPFPGNSDESNGWSYMDLIGTPPSDAPDNWLDRESLKEEIRRSLSKLTERESQILKLYFWIGIPHALTLEEIGAKIDLTRERVRQIKEKAIRRLKHNSRSRQLQQFLGQ